MAQPKWGVERSREDVYGPTPTRESVQRLPEDSNDWSSTPPVSPALSPEARPAVTEQEKKEEAIRVTAGFLALTDKLTPDAARRNLDEEEGHSIQQEAARRALQSQTPAATIMRQQAMLPQEALNVLMNTPIGGDQPPGSIETSDG